VNCAADCPANPCNNNGTCEAGETAANCAADCGGVTCDNDGTCDPGETVELRARVLQLNIPLEEKWSPDLEVRQKVVFDYRDLTRLFVEASPHDLVIWPETALPFYPRNKELLQPVSDFLDDSGAEVLTGAPWYEVESGTASRRIHYFNSALLLSRGGAISGSYYKSHLVPYGEYVPLQKYLGFLAPLVEAAGDFTPGTVGEPLTSGMIRAGVLICYESIFGSIGRRWVENGANILINLTNDAWYGKSSAPFQSWAMSLFRSVETRRSLVRSANTGISGFIDPLGRIKEESELFVPWSKAAQMVLMDTKTVYVRAGYLFAPLCAALALVMVVLAGLGRRKNT
jgi:apolipoprotein N-acyltransferase